MATTGEITKEMDALDMDALAILANPNLTPVERRFAIEGLLRQYRVLEDYQRALAAFIRRMRNQRQRRDPDPEEVIREILASPEFMALRLVVLAAFVSVIYGNGSRLAWVPLALVPVVVAPGRWL